MQQRPITTPGPEAPVREIVRRLQVTAEELEFLGRLSPILATPRAVKKMANLYRLARASVSADNLDRFMGSAYAGAPFHAVGIILSVLVGRPEHAVGALQTLLLAHHLEDPLALIQAAHPAEDIEWLAVSNTIGQLRLGPQPVLSDLLEYRRWSIELSRYSFHTQAIWKAYG